MAKLNFDLDDLTNNALKRLVKQLLTAEDGDEKKVLDQLRQGSKRHEASESKSKERSERNDLADLDEEMHGKPNTPTVTNDDLPHDGELADIPKKRKK